MKNSHATAAVALALGLSVTALQAGSIGDFFKKLSAFDFGGSKFGTSELDDSRKWGDRDRWVRETLDKAYQALERS